ncbi:Gfo/Idh/MocA family oxidoreductase [Polymorphobacter sp. PAMC 29334]|uniref:Gfo/Idh/MocA family protein n=1 Tax=Polymorphobacter sp. PAMC 29334 TaxID=2862331 RepID=UPI001C67FF37|nr:Gfo/Idh/MocA family oxidoreductase [Polymorphobacter sp. PAMC 29334]QYE35840.1 Gfo/Idh/MocA family oxidoreductase [Polymorphobacter sp. PAMC 29334]
MTIKLGILGVGKIAHDQHLPAIAANPAFTLVGAANRSGAVDGIRTFPDLDALVAGVPGLEAITICTPPQDRHTIVRAALNHGLHVMLEKPPGASLSEIADLPGLAAAKNVALFATYHSRYAPAVAPAKAWLADKHITNVRVRWKENVRQWHPGQAWIWEPGGLGVFDPGINAMSSLTEILPAALLITKADLSFPANRGTPIAAMLELTDIAGLAISVELDWRQVENQMWEIAVDTDAGSLLLSGGGAMLDIAGTKTDDQDQHAEYEGLYKRFAELVPRREVDFDIAPIKLIADAFMLGKRIEVEAFTD